MDSNFVDFRGKKVLVAGASSGIGRQISITLNNYGATIIAVARSEDKLQDLVSNLHESNNKYYSADLSATDNIESLVKRITSENGPLDGFVYSAGISYDRPLSMCKPSVVQQMFSINFFGFYEMVRVLTKKKNYNPGFSIVGISSAAADGANKSQSVYSASKAAMDASIKVIAQEVGPKGIRINTIRPGMINTDMYKRYQSEFGEAGDQLILSRQFLGIGETVDIANAVCFLLSEKAKFVTGIHMSVDGGFRAC